MFLWESEWYGIWPFYLREFSLWWKWDVGKRIELDVKFANRVRKDSENDLRECWQSAFPSPRKPPIQLFIEIFPNHWKWQSMSRFVRCNVNWTEFDEDFSGWMLLFSFVCFLTCFVFLCGEMVLYLYGLEYFFFLVSGLSDCHPKALSSSSRTQSLEITRLFRNL